MCNPIRLVTNAKHSSYCSIAWLICLVALVLLLPPRLCLADAVNPTPSDEKCPDGSPRNKWQYPTAGPTPGNVTGATCNGQPCAVAPISACLSTVEVPGSVQEPDRPAVTEPPSAAAPPLIRHLSTEPLPGSERPVSAAPGGAIKLADDHICVAGTGWDFEDLQAPPKLPTKATMQGWKGVGVFGDVKNSDLDLPMAPVYGNAAPIDAIRPAGWQPTIATDIGGIIGVIRNL
jgi:hypothetical protein